MANSQLLCNALIVYVKFPFKLNLAYATVSGLSVEVDSKRGDYLLHADFWLGLDVKASAASD